MLRLSWAKKPNSNADSLVNHLQKFNGKSWPEISSGCCVQNRDHRFSWCSGSTMANSWKLLIASALRPTLTSSSCIWTASLRMIWEPMSAEPRTKLEWPHRKPNWSSQVITTHICPLSLYLQTDLFPPDLEEIKKQKPPSFTGALSDTWGSESDELKLSCYVGGYPQPEVTWFFNGQPLKKSEYLDLKYDGQEATLHFHYIRPEDAGLYTCKLKNKHGGAECSCDLSVSTRPKFVGRFQDVEVFKGEEAVFKTKFVGYPKPEVAWFLNRQPLIVSILLGIGVISLILNLNNDGSPYINPRIPSVWTTQWQMMRSVWPFPKFFKTTRESTHVASVTWLARPQEVPTSISSEISCELFSHLKFRLMHPFESISMPAWCLAPWKIDPYFNQSYSICVLGFCRNNYHCSVFNVTEKNQMTLQMRKGTYQWSSTLCCAFSSEALSLSFMSCTFYELRWHNLLSVSSWIYPVKRNSPCPIKE